MERNPDIRDFYDANDEYTVTNEERNDYHEFLDDLEPWERATLERAIEEDLNYYVLEFSNLGGLVMPILLELEFVDGSKRQYNIPAEIWRRNAKQVKKLLVLDKELQSVAVDPQWETADVNVDNNYYPRRFVPSRIEMFKTPDREGLEYRDIMQDSKTQLDVCTDDADAADQPEDCEQP